MNNVKIKPNVIVICGPTGVGKTAVGIELAKRFNGEIIGADSMQIYRYMDIGTAKPTQDEQAEVEHHMIDVANPDEDYDAETYMAASRKIIHDLHNQGVLPIVVGGTGFYIKALEYGLFGPGVSDPVIRDRLRKEAEISGSSFLYEKLAQCDPVTADVIHPNDTYRIIRALEVYEMTGEGISTYRDQHSFSDNPFRTLKIGLKMAREALYKRINERVDRMIDLCFLDEVKGLLRKSYHADLKSMQSIGYRHMALFIEGQVSWEEAVRTMKRDTRRYAKRQLTWFNADDSVIWIEQNQLNNIDKRVKCFLKN